MNRIHNFSRMGYSLDQHLHSCTKRKQQEEVKKILSSKPLSNVKKSKSMRQMKFPRQDFRTTITRETPSSFQKCHNKVQNSNIIYNSKLQITKPKVHHYSLKKFHPQCYFQTLSNFYIAEHDGQIQEPCEKHIQKQKASQLLSTKRSLTFRQNLSEFQKNIRNTQPLDFSKQTERPFFLKLKKLAENALYQGENPQSQLKEKQQKQKEKKQKKIHSFKSYSQHKLLNPQKLATFSSAMDSHKFNLKSFKQKNHNTNIRFDKFVQVIRTKYDRDCVPWFVKLSYDPNDQILRSTKCIRSFSKQSSRKLNEVHSKYPIRLAA